MTMIQRLYYIIHYAEAYRDELRLRNTIFYSLFCSPLGASSASNLIVQRTSTVSEDLVTQSDRQKNTNYYGQNMIIDRGKLFILDFYIRKQMCGSRNFKFVKFGGRSIFARYLFLLVIPLRRTAVMGRTCNTIGGRTDSRLTGGGQVGGGCIPRAGYSLLCFGDKFGESVFLLLRSLRRAWLLFGGPREPPRQILA